AGGGAAGEDVDLLGGEAAEVPGHANDGADRGRASASWCYDHPFAGRCCCPAAPRTPLARATPRAPAAGDNRRAPLDPRASPTSTATTLARSAPSSPAGLPGVLNHPGAVDLPQCA
ncbi:hypothetical protein SVAN01_10192, partial [Stagonosporopsis vannaccii]